MYIVGSNVLSVTCTFYCCTYSIMIKTMNHDITTSNTAINNIDYYMHNLQATII